MQAETLFSPAGTAAADQALQRFEVGNALLAGGDPVAAAEAFLAAAQLAPEFAPAWLNLAETLRSLGAVADAVAMAEQALALRPGDPHSLQVMGNARHDLGDFEAAAGCYRAALIRAPDHAGLWTNLGNSLHAMGRATEALGMQDRAVALTPEDAEAHFCRALTLLASGDFARGWAEYEWRFRRPGRQGRRFGPAWRGEPIEGRTILLHAEQGHGDTLQFLRYAPMVVARGARVVLEVQPALRRLAESVPGVVQVVAAGEPLPQFAAHCPLLSLPLACDTRLATIPAGVPYLAADPGAWSARLPPGLRIGLCWAGAATEHGLPFPLDQRRSLDPALLAPLAKLPGAVFVSLQKEPRGIPPLPLLDPMPLMRDFADTAGLVAALDLVISVDTSVAHLAGALGRPVWLLSRADPCWRWLHGRDDSPWYPTMRIFRQRAPGDWQGVIGRVLATLQAEGPPRQSASGSGSGRPFRATSHAGGWPPERCLS